MTTVSPGLKVLVNEAEELESLEDWPGAARSYSQVLADASLDDPRQRAEIREKHGRALLSAGLQANDPDEFRSRMSGATIEYERARSFYSKRHDPESRARKTRSESMVAFLAYWLAAAPTEKKRQIRRTWDLAKKTLGLLEAVGNRVEYGRTYNQLCTSAFLTVCFDSNFRVRRTILWEAAHRGEKAIDFLIPSAERRQLVKAYVKTASFFGWLIDYVENPEEKDECLGKTKEYWRKAIGLSETQAIEEAPGVESYPLYQAMTPDETLAGVQRALDHVRRIGDRFATGAALDFLACLEWDELLSATEDRDQKLHLAERALGHSEEARHQYHLVNFTSPLGYLSLWDEEPRAEYYWGLAQNVETDPAIRRSLLRRGLEAATAMLKQAKTSGYPEVILNAHHVQSKLLSAIAQTETNRVERRRLLEQSLEHRNRSAILTRRLKPHEFFSHSLQEKNSAEIKTKLANVVNGIGSQARMLRNALRHQDAAIRLSDTELQRWERHGWRFFISSLGRWKYDSAGLLTRLYELARDRRYLKRAGEASEEAAELFRKIASDGEAAECYWYSAFVYDALSDYEKAAESFELASESFHHASGRIPALKEYYLDCATYLKAWSEIERARRSHERQDCQAAEQHYRRGSTLLQSTRMWKNVASNCLAWARLEEAEYFSVQKRNQEAADAFVDAGKLFEESKVILTTQLSQGKGPDAHAGLTGLVQTSEVKQKYCKARSEFEQAQILDKQGDHLASAEKYAKAASGFRNVAKMVKTAQDREELSFMAVSSNACETMARAEGLTSPELFLEASRLFAKARTFAQNDKQSTLALGHSSLCEGLAYGSKLVGEGETRLRSSAIRHLDNAANYYLRAGLAEAGEYASAVKTLLDAYVFTRLASRQTDPEERIETYRRAEKTLQSCADGFSRAGYERKRREVLGLVEKVNRERDLAESMVELLGVPQATLARLPFIGPASDRESPVSLGRLEHSRLHGVVRVPRNRVAQGGKFELAIEITNTGSAIARLLKLEGLVPEGLELLEWPQEYIVKGGHLDMKGKGLAPLKTEKVELILKPRNQGLFSLEPSVTFTDETGDTYSQLIEPVDILASPILEFLVTCFVEDFGRKRLSPDDSGWRSLMEIVGSLRLPRSQLYGDPRQGHSLGPALKDLVRSGVVEYRIFSGQRGRGGRIVRVRVSYALDSVKRLVDEFVTTPPRVEVPIIEKKT